MTLATRTLIGMGLGIVVGVFFGERVAFLGVVGDAFIALLQMSVLPYVVTSLIGEVGRLRMREAVSLGKSVGLALLAIWVITLETNLTMPLAFPDWVRASFYSTSMVSEPAQFDFVEQYIPINLFNPLSSNIIPAVVVFCLAVGIILIRIDRAEKETLLSVLSVFSSALATLTAEIAKLSPYGAFAIVASLPGTLRPEELEMLQVYVAAFLVISLILVFWTFPVLLVTVTPVSYGRIFRSSRDALVTAFATGSLFVVIPLLARGARELFTEADPEDAAKTSVDIAVASSLSLPTAGKILTLSYVLFAGWLAGAPLHASNYLSFSTTGLFSFFGSVYQAIPYLLDLYQIPADTFQFFPAVNNLINVRFGTPLAAVHTLTLAVLAGGTAIGIISFR